VSKKKSSSSSASSDNSGSDDFDMSKLAAKISNEIKEIAGEEPKNKTIETVEALDEGNQDQIQGNVYIHSSKCMNCVHLLPTLGKKAHSSCHYTKGNDQCPASEIRIVVMLPYEKIATKLYNAHMENNPAKIASLMARLNRQDPEEATKVLKRYSELLAENIK